MKSIMRMSALVAVTFGGIVLTGCAAASGGGAEPTAQAEESLSGSICPAGVPSALAPAADQTIKASFSGVGVQIYICIAKASNYAWQLVAPQANLLNDDGRLVGTHFIGPTWQSNDGSSVMGLKAAGATVDSSAIPWLLLTASGHGSVDGRFSDVTSIQRLDTVGGIAPSASDCSATTVGTLVQVPYTAQYVLYRTKSHGNVNQCNGG